MRPGAQQVRLHGSRGGVFVDHRPPRPPETPVIPCFYKHYHILYMPHRWSFTSVQTFHTHTHSAVGRVFLVQMRWRWGWRGGKWGWYGSEGEMKKYLTGTWGGECKRRGERANTNTNTPGPERANPERAREKKSGGRQTRNKTSGGGEGRQRLNQPHTAKPTPTYRHARDPTYLGREERMK